MIKKILQIYEDNIYILVYYSIYEVIKKMSKTKNKENEEEAKPLDLLMWVGGSFYSIESCIKEYKRFGACKRISNVPKLIKLGESRCFLVHDQNEKERIMKKRGIPRVFGYFVISAIEAVVDDPVKFKKYIEKGIIKPISVTTAMSRPERGCGSMVPGAIYVVSEEDMDKAIQKGLAKVDNIGGKHFFTINPPIEAKGLPRFRGYKYVKGDNILKKKPLKEWFVDKKDRLVARLASGRYDNLDPWVKQYIKDMIRGRKTYRETAQEILREYKLLPLRSFIEECQRRNPTISKHPRRVWRGIADILVRNGFAKIEKQGKERIIRIVE